MTDNLHKMLPEFVFNDPKETRLGQEFIFGYPFINLQGF